MKKNIGLIIVLAAEMLLTLSCQESKPERFEREAREYTQKKCPQKLDADGIFVLDSMVFNNDGTMVMRNYYTVDVDSAGLKAFIEKKDEMRQLLLHSIQNSADMRHVREEGLSIEYIYKNKENGRQIGRFLFKKEDYE